MVLHKDEEAFKALISLTSQTLGIEEIYIEKDYFVVLALKGLSTSGCRQNGIFKGGTSLSKSYGILNRFSEDIDVAILNDDGDDIGGRAAMKRVEEALTSADCFEEDKAHERSKKKGARLRQTVHKYPLLRPEEDYGQASRHLFIDASRMSVGIPFEERSVTTYISDYLRETDQEHVIEEYQLHPVQVLTLSMERTFIEKLGSTVKFAFKDEREGPDDLLRLKRGIRHIYDLHMLVQQEKIRRFMLDEVQFHGMHFNTLWTQVLADDLHGNREKAGYADYMNSDFAECILYRDPEETWNKLQPTYETDFARLHFKRAALPTSDAILETLRQLKAACQRFDAWRSEAGVKFVIEN